VSSPASVSPGSHAIFITEVIEMGGAERSCLAMARWMHEQGLPVHLLTYQDKVGLEKFASHPLTVVQLRPVMQVRHKVASLRHYFAMQPSHAPKPLVSGYQPALHATLAGVRGFHCLMHDTPSLFSYTPERSSMARKIYHSIANKVVSHGLKSGGATIVTSEYLKAETKEVFGVEASIARMGGLPQKNAFRLRPPTGKLKMLSVSRVEANKRIDWLIRGLAALEKVVPSLSAEIDWQLDIAGKGSVLEEMKRLAGELGVGQRIKFHGFVSDEELQQLYEEADLFLMPAMQGYGIPAIESLSRGIPVLLHRQSGVSDILLNTPWATVMEGGEEAMASTLNDAIRKVGAGAHLHTPLPEIPTEDEWAARVARLCRWV
jgi:glycosyltransferase involved in cell wall biosynthesis